MMKEHNHSKRSVFGLLAVLLLSPGLSAEPLSEEADTQETGIYSAMSLGTAWAVTRQHVVTNYHVIANTRNLRLVTPEQMEIPVQIVATDPKNDLAILAVLGRARLGNTLPIGDTMANLGSPVFTIGYPHPDLMGTSPKLTAGHINSLTGIADDPRIYQIDVPVQSGNSGGPLLNMNGEVIAIITSKLNAKKLFERTGDVPQNVNYAIKIKELEALLIKSDIGARVKRNGFNKPQSLESLADASLKSVLIIAGDTPRGKKKKNTVLYAHIPEQKNNPVVNAEEEKPSSTEKQIRMSIYSYIEPDSFYQYQDNNKAGSKSIQGFSDNVALLLNSNLKKLTADSKITSYTGKSVKDMHVFLEKGEYIRVHCNKDDADFMYSVHSKDNSGIGQHFRDVSFIIVDCKSRRNFKKNFTVRLDELNDRFDYELSMNYSFKDFLSSIPPFIQVNSSENIMLADTPRGKKIAVYSYAQPGHYDKETNIPGSSSTGTYSDNSSLLLRTHLLSTYGKESSIKRYTGKQFKSVYYRLENYDMLKHYCRQNKTDYIVASYSESSGGRFIHSREIKYVIANCNNNRVYKKIYHLERDEKYDRFGYETAIHNTFKDFLIKLPAFINSQS